MPVDLHQRLSEFSYGYGVTREVERQLESVGLKVTPFLPSLLQEAKLGFDVAFDRPGIALLLQFKLGEVLQRFRSTAAFTAPAALSRPFWRFNVETSEQGGQYDLLLKSQRAGAEVYYVAPRFANWDTYVLAFQNGKVLEESVLVSPAEIDQKLASQGAADGWHRIVYDNANLFACSDPIRLDEVKALNLPSTVRVQLEQRKQRMDFALKELYSSLGTVRAIRTENVSEADIIHDVATRLAILGEISPTPEQTLASRNHRLEIFRAKAVDEASAIFATVGVEAWAIGAQLIAVTQK
jgi:hypothetical protein